MPTKAKTSLLSDKIKDDVRKAYRAGKKRITVDGITYDIKRKDRKVTFTAGGEHQTQKESWLVLTRTDGRLVPKAQIELKHLGNLRSSIS